ncbi:MAG: PAS domain-containing sensor histidine kinase [Methanomicrobium sp.]|nr:PAS domain-containing sensor histidine kinase [Methanomicrobium sp.]
MTDSNRFKITELFPSGICVIDSDFRIAFWNRLISYWTGKSMDEVAGKRLDEVFPNIKDSPFEDRIKDIFSGASPAVFSSQFHDAVIPTYLPSGERRIQTMTMMPYATDDGAYVVIVVEDVTELKREVTAYRRMKDSAIIALNDKINAEKETVRANDEANVYISIMSHDLKNTNAIIMSYALKLAESGNEEIANYAKKIMLASTGINDIIRNVSAVRKMSQKSQGLRPFSLKAVLTDAAKSFEGLNYEITGEDRRILCDDLIAELFSNIFSNCVTHAGIDSKIHISIKETDKFVRVSVADEGPGISEELKADIFSRFNKSVSDDGDKEEGEGTGLYIVKVLMTRYNGNVAITDANPGSDRRGLKICLDFKAA